MSEENPPAVEEHTAEWHEKYDVTAYGSIKLPKIFTDNLRRALGMEFSDVE